MGYFHIQLGNVLLSSSIPLIALLEGFCTFRILRKASIVSSSIIRKGRNETAIIGMLLLSSVIISSSLYVLWEVLLSSRMQTVDATVGSVTITSLIIASGWGVARGKCHPLETSLFLAYSTLCIYQIFAISTLILKGRCTTLEQVVSPSFVRFARTISNRPPENESLLELLESIPSPIAVSLSYRVALFAFVGRNSLLTGLKSPMAKVLSILPCRKGSFALFLWLGPLIAVIMYTSLLYEHFRLANNLTGLAWRWVSLYGTIIFHISDVQSRTSDAA